MEVIYYSQQMAKVYSYKQMVVEGRVSIDTLCTFVADRRIVRCTFQH